MEAIVEEMDSEKQVSINKKQLKDEVADYLVSAVFKGEFKPGDRLAETKIARSLNISQGVVREAFQLLRTRGFLESIPFKGTFVRAFTDQGLKDYFRTRTEIEMIAVKWSSEFPEDPDNTAYLMKCIELMENYRKEGDKSLASKADLDFHRAIVKSANSPSLLSAWEALNHGFWFSYGIHLEENRYMALDRQAELHASLFELLRINAIEDFRMQLEEHFINPYSSLRG